MQTSKSIDNKIKKQRPMLNYIDNMIKDGLVFKDKNGLSVNSSMKNTLTQFMAFLKQKDYFDEVIDSEPSAG